MSAAPDERAAVPWSVGSVKNGRGYRDEVMVYDRDGVLIANCEAPKIDARRFARTEAEDRANARLVASAPTLLAALENLIGEIGPDWPDSWDALVYEEAIAALANVENDSLTATQSATDDRSADGGGA